MKKGLLLAGILAVITGTAANAQRVNYGLKATLMFSNIKGEGLESGFKPGFQGGAFFEFNLTKDKKWGIQPELLFTQSSAKKGTDFSRRYVTHHNTSAREKISMSAATVPLLVRYSPIPALTFNLGAQYTYMYFIDENLLKGNRDAFKKSDVGAVAGAQVNVGNVRFIGRYVMGLSNINNVPAPQYDWKTNQITVGIGVAFK
ncbi:porin family protein [Chitinophaga rhizophila]|uniref:PorT family protein n=1 Tax=Chitinophaga rhizophila TaxID=2866212 RepID=A0ABS7GIN5_9BACT|nr:porin family protein [Chitinophaga rhizophila]MBW8687549.1 PorT family protein [Chitinophaga rhizophila]